MAKFLCDCGHTIRDQATDIPYKAEIIRDGDWEEFFGWIASNVSDFIKASKEGRRAEWIESYYSTPHPKGLTDLDDANVVADILNAASLKCGSAMFQCEDCGRLYISRSRCYEKWDFVTFLPEEQSDGILNANRTG